MWHTHHIDRDEVKVERINPALIGCTRKKEKKNYGRIIPIAIFVIGIFVVSALSKISNIFGLFSTLPCFFLLGYTEISELFRKFCYVRKRRKKKSCRSQELFVMFFSVITSQFLIGTSYSKILEDVQVIYKEEYEKNLHILTPLTIFYILFSPLSFFSSVSTSRGLFFGIIALVISIFIANLLEKKNFSRKSI